MLIPLIISSIRFFRKVIKLLGFSFKICNAYDIWNIIEPKAKKGEAIKPITTAKINKIKFSIKDKFFPYDWPAHTANVIAENQ